MRRKTIPATLPVLILLLALLTGCGGQKQARTEHETLTLLPGESVRIELQNVPEGKTAADYTWDCGRELTVSPDGEVHAELTGTSYVRATLKYRGTLYFEYIPVTVPTQIGGLTISETSCLLLAGLSEDLHVEPDVKLDVSEKIVWTSSDETVVTVARNGNLVNNFNDASVFLKGVAPGQATVTAAFGGAEVSCEVTVFSNDAPGRIALCYVTRAGDVREVSGAVTLELQPGADAADFPEPEDGALAAASAGKLLIDLNGDYSLTALLPEACRPDSFAEVAYVLEIEAGDTFCFYYDSGASALARTADIVLRDAATGRVVETVAHLEGPPPPNTVTVNAGATKVWGADIDSRRIEEAFCARIAALWLESCGSVTFTRDGETVYVY